MIIWFWLAGVNNGWAKCFFFNSHFIKKFKFSLWSLMIFHPSSRMSFAHSWFNPANWPHSSPHQQTPINVNSRRDDLKNFRPRFLLLMLICRFEVYTSIFMLHSLYVLYHKIVMVKTPLYLSFSRSYPFFTQTQEIFDDNWSKVILIHDWFMWSFHEWSWFCSKTTTLYTH